jgi:Ca2+-binding RTX toxin-like protein
MPTIAGTDASETLDAADGVTNSNDIILGYGGNDTIFGLGGNDSLQGGSGADRLDGGAGRDTAYYSDSDTGVLVNLESGLGFNGTAQGDVLVSVESLMGSRFADWLLGNGGDNSLWGFEGNDALKGGGGSDFLYGGIGADTLDGGEGIDTVGYHDSSEGVVISLIDDTASGGTAAGDQLDNIENIIGSPYGDQLTGDNQDNVLQGVDGNDTLRGYGGQDVLVGGYGTDTLYGMDGFDTLYGQAGTDWLYGGDQTDDLFGQSDADHLFGEGGTDSLDGGAGADTLDGGAGADTFVWSFTSETGLTLGTMDQIMNFNFAEGDRIDLSTVDADVYAPGNQTFTFIGTAPFSGTPGEINYYYSGGNTIIQLQTGTSADIEGGIILAGIHTPTSDWFLR